MAESLHEDAYKKLAIQLVKDLELDVSPFQLEMLSSWLFSRVLILDRFKELGWVLPHVGADIHRKSNSCVPNGCVPVYVRGDT